VGWVISKALMNSLCSQERAAESLAGTFSDGEQSAPSNLSHTPQAYLLNVKTTGFSRLSRFGMTFGHLTDDRGAELLTLYQAGFPVRTSVSRGKETDLTASGQDSGWKWPGSWAKYDPDSCSWKTRQCSLLEDSTEFSETWPRWGMTVDGELFPQPTLVRRISGKECGLWPTPNTVGYRSDGELAILARTLTDHSEFVAMTSHAANSKRIRAWPTPTVQDAKNNGAQSQMGRNTKPLNAEVGGSLNPSWVEWLMGWPEGWTDLKPLEMDKFRKWLASHGGC